MENKIKLARDKNLAYEAMFRLARVDTPEARKWISRKIAYLIKEEGLTQKQAAGKAYGMYRDGSWKKEGK